MSKPFDRNTAFDTHGGLKALRTPTNFTPYDAAALLNLKGFRTSQQAMVAVEKGRAVGRQLIVTLERLYTNAAATEGDRRRHVA